MIVVPNWSSPGFICTNSCLFFLKSKISFIIPLGTIPSTGEGIVTRQACQRGFSDCCSTSYDIKVRNCGRYTAYCLRALSTCPARYCFGKHIWFLLLLPYDFFPGARDIFRLLASSLGWYFIGTGQCNSEESKDSDKNGNNKKKGFRGFSVLFNSFFVCYFFLAMLATLIFNTMNAVKMIYIKNKWG